MSVKKIAKDSLTLDNEDALNMGCVSDDDDKLREAKVESLRSVVVPAINNSPSYAARNYSARMQTEKDSLTFDNEDALNTTVSSVGNYVKPKKNRGKRKRKDDISGSDAILIALKDKVRSMQ